MNCSNYANWELTQSLPELNLWSDSHCSWYERGEIVELKTSSEASEERITQLNPSKYLRNAWTWEDIRLYLASKGFHVEIYKETTYEVNFIFPECEKGIFPYETLSPFPASDNEFWWDRPTPLEYKEYATYEEAREDGIKWCLELIKMNE